MAPTWSFPSCLSVKVFFLFFFTIHSELDRRHQSAFLKKRFCIHHVPPARAADKKIQPT